MKKILLLCPIYNEEVQVRDTMLKLKQYADNNLSAYEVCLAVVDNASKDRSPEICRNLEKELSNFKYYRLEEKGRGLALNYIWRTADYDFAIYMDVDLSTGLDHILDSIKAFEAGADITYGSRKSKNSNVSGRNMKRTLTSWGYVNTVQFLSGSKISDFQCGFKGIRKDIAMKVMPIMQDRKWFFDTELLLSSEVLGYKVVEIPVEWKDDPDSTVKVLKDSNNMFQALINFLYKPSFNVYSEDRELNSKNIEFKRFQFLIFAFIGGTSFLIEYLISTLVFAFGFGSNSEIYVISKILTGYMFAAIIGYSISAIYNFTLNKLITFKTRLKNTRSEMLKFIIVVAFSGLILQNILLYILVDLVNFNVNIAFITKAILILIFNYFVHKYFTFKDSFLN